MKKLILILLYLVPMAGLRAQIEGHIYDQFTQEPIPYVNIWIKNKMIGTTSDEKGYFFLEYNELSDTLVFPPLPIKTKQYL